MSRPKQRSRRGEPLPHDAALVLRGDELDPGLLTETARENSVIYFFFGISVFVEAGGFTWETIASERLVRAEWLAIFTVGDLLSAGLELWDTGRAPHYDVVHERCSELVTRFVGCPHRLVENPHYEPPEGGA
jgi:hypothetical protein